MKINKDFRPITLKIETSEDLEFISTVCHIAMDSIRKESNRWCRGKEFDSKYYEIDKFIRELTD